MHKSLLPIMELPVHLLQNITQALSNESIMNIECSCRYLNEALGIKIPKYTQISPTSIWFDEQWPLDTYSFCTYNICEEPDDDNDNDDTLIIGLDGTFLVMLGFFRRHLGLISNIISIKISCAVKYNILMNNALSSLFELFLRFDKPIKLQSLIFINNGNLSQTRCSLHILQVRVQGTGL